MVFQSVLAILALLDLLSGPETVGQYLTSGEIISGAGHGRQPCANNIYKYACLHTNFVSRHTGALLL